jgi:lactate oxidase
MSTSRRDLLKLTGAGAASAALAAAGFVWVQVKEEAENEPVTIVRKGIDKQIEVINVDLLEAEARRRLSEVVYVFIAHGAGEQWTLHENRRAFEDYVFTPHRIGGALRRQPVSASQPRP